MPEGDAIKSTPKLVRFFEDRAEVVRTATATLSEGTQWVRVSGASMFTDDRSVQAKAQGAEVLAARVTRNRRLVPKLEYTEAVKLHERVNALRLEVQSNQLLQQRHNELVNVAEKLFQRWALTLAVQQNLAGDEAIQHWRAASEAMLKRWDEGADEVQRLREKVEDLNREISELAARAGLADYVDQHDECLIEVQVNARSAGDCELELTYRTPCALWRPEHSARLTQGKDPSMEWTSFGVIWHNTGEEWRDVEVRFSTARPAAVADAPNIEDDELSLRKKTAEERKEIRVEVREQVVSKLEQRAEPDMPGVDDGGKPVEFAPKGRFTLAGDGKPVRVEISRRSLKCSLERALYPERSQAAFLKATANWQGESPLLAGPLAVMRGASLVGRTRAEFVAVGEQFDIGFGPEDGVRCRRAVTEQRETAKLTGSQTITREVTLRLSNLSSDIKAIDVTERLPVSEIEGLEIKPVEVKGWQQDAKDGYLKQRVELQPRGQQTLTIKYEIRAKSNVILPF
ncbi:MAG: DUF4139 domain-containing protein [Planctomycetes bacterium]|nr:DUF4139 domain-containing protein [Planctomycetota bacterium]MCW8135079.1 DUF4139 domain-containing protein [Planctomycetota bacterium]